MRTFRRWLLRFFVLVVLLVIVAIAAATLLPLDPLKPAVESRLSDYLGRKVTVASVRLSLTEAPALSLSGMRVSEDPGFGDSDFLSANKVVAKLDPYVLVRQRRILIREMKVEAPQLQFVRNPDGEWSWDTIGAKTQRAAGDNGASRFAHSLLTLASNLIPSVSIGGLRHIQVDDATVTLSDKSTGRTAVYKNITLSASVTPPSHTAPEAATHAAGEFISDSTSDSGGELLKADLPFDLMFGRRNGASLFAKGSVGPGRVETSNVRIGEFSLNGDLQAERGLPLAGSGQLSASDLFFPAINLRQNIAPALKTNSLGDMEPGPQGASLDTDFQLDKGAVKTSRVRIQQLDGLGDAVAPEGTFNIDSSLVVDYSGTVTLSPESTTRLKSTSSMLGIIATVLEVNNRLSIPI